MVERKPLPHAGRYAPGRNRTCDLSLRRRTLYPLSYGRRRRLSVPPRLSTSAAAGGLTAAAPGAGLRNQIDRRSDARSADLRALSGRRTLYPLSYGRRRRAKCIGLLVRLGCDEGDGSDRDVAP